MECKFLIWVSFLSIVFAKSERSFIDGRLKPEGFITDGEGPYKQDLAREWLIKARPGESITLTFSVLVTECSFDYVFIYDGKTQYGNDTTLLATISGSSTPSSFHAKSGFMLIVFFTDQNSNRLGFNATYRVSPCPNDCNKNLDSKHECVKDKTSGSYHCICAGGYYEGDDCSIPTCIEGCGYHAFRGDCVRKDSPHGTSSSTALANKDIHHYGCVCESGFFGESCILEKDKKHNYHTWTRLFSNKRAGPTSATGAAAVVIKNHQEDVLMYIFGGFDLTSVLSTFLVYNVFHSSWRDEIPANSDQVPSARAFHTMTLIENSTLVVIGGVLKFQYADQSERMAHSVWVYDTAAKVWTEYNSPPSVPAFADHTATLVDHEIFVIGGRLANDSFNNLIYVLHTLTMTWSVRNPTGHSSLFLRRVGHSSVYDTTRKTLVIFGGYVPSKPNFSVKTNDMLAYSPSENYLSKWETVERDEGAKPDNLAQHTAVVMGNYMVVFGGSMSEKTTNEDTCVMNQTFLFHLDCHMWIDNNKVLIGSGGLSMSLHAPPPRKGHVAVLLDDNLMAIYGGYDGTVRSDIYVYKAAPTLFDRNEETHCREASIDETLCHRDPKCRYCAGFVGNNRCVSPEQLEQRPCESYVTQGMCPGVCASMTDCKSCLLFGDTQCGWCPATQTCQNLTDADCPVYMEETGGLVRIKDSCKRDFPSGFLQSTFFQPINFKFPDYVSFGVKPDLTIFYDMEKEARYDVSMQSPTSHSPIIIELSGRLTNANTLRGRPRYHMLLENSNVTFTLANPDESIHFRPAVDMLGHPVPIEFMINRSLCNSEKRGCRVQLTISQKVVNRQATGQMRIFWDGEAIQEGTMLPMSVAHLRPHFIEPGGCERYESCITCTGKGVGNCGWHPESNKCVFKWADSQREILNHDLTLYPHQCSVCIHYVDCETCNSHPGCIWARTSTTVQCLRRPTQDILDADSKLPSKQRKYKSSDCLKPCHMRKTCQECFLLESDNERKSECSWCSSLNKCLPFYMYLPAYSYGVCKSYSEKNTEDKCAECSQFQKCSKCLEQPGCGFCESNGQCVAGGFDGPTNRLSCSPPRMDSAFMGSSLVTPTLPSFIETFHFTKCPKTNECADTHLCELERPGSYCVNTEESYSCECPHGFKKSTDASGRPICQETCEKSCGENGICERNQITQAFECICDKGYYGEQCLSDCNCNKRSHCKQAGQCLKCDEGYQGHDCGSCQDGWYEYMGECRRCKCNGNGDPRKGLCDKENGRCFCVNNTDGDHCDRCKESAGYYSKPDDNNVCYKMCTGWAIMSGIDGISYIGSEQGDGAKNPERVVCIWQISTKDDPSPKSPAISGGSKITFEITALNVECNEQYVYVYENTPSFLTGEGATSESSMNSDNHQRDKILGAFCGNHSPRHKRVVEAESTITVVFKANITQGNQFFNAKISVHEKPCMGNWIPRGEDSCECPMNMTGWNCDQIACPNNCSAHLNQGNCVEDDRSFCNCSRGFSGDDCSAKITHYYKAQWSNLLKGTFAREAKYGRLGHTMVADQSKKFLYIIGGRNFNANPVDMLKYSIDENKLSTVRSDFLIIPYRGYYHSSAITDSDTVYVFGGLGQMNHKCSRTFWHFIPDAKTQNEKIQMPTVAKDDYPAYSEPGHTWIPTAAQHTMNYVKLRNRSNNGTVTVLIIIGGYSPEHGFNNYTLQYNIETKAWSSVHTVGTKPIGIFGHSTVYYERWSTFYVYGGYVYSKNSVSLSKELYSVKYEQDGRPAKWSVVFPKGDLKPPSAIAFHQSVVIGDYMVVIGGRTKTVEFSNEVRIYLITCNAWIAEGESFAADRVFSGTRMDPVIGHSAVAIGNDIYVYGGFNGVTLQSMHKLSMPTDICNLLNGAKQTECERIPGCSFCRAMERRAECGFQETCCFNASNKATDHSCKLGEWSPSRGSNQCFMPSDEFRMSSYEFWPSTMRAECQKHETCEQCLSEYEPYLKSSDRVSCRWLTNQGRCDAIDAYDTLPVLYDSSNVLSQLYQCRGSDQTQCHQSDCQKCQDFSHCQWSGNYKLEGHVKKVTYSSHGVYEWGCFPGFLSDLAQIPKEDTCPAPCHSYENCSSCLNSGGADGGWKQCYWAQELGICISPTFAAMQCAAGECGRVVTHSAEGCPKVCEDQTQCATCAQMTHCGWCSLQSGAEHLGLGACWEGGLNGPRQQRCTSDSVISHLLSRPKTEQTLETYILFSLRGHSWSHSSCPQEDECTNNHHNCDSKTQNCVDLPDGFRCECKQDFSWNEKTGKCEPQCDPPCAAANGTCAEPNTCKCFLGFTGPTCEDSCACYGHSECSSSMYYPCEKCQHNTVGKNCDNCERKYYGNASNPTSTACTKCSKLCNGKSDYCVPRDKYEQKFKHLTTIEQKMAEFEESVLHGPNTTDHSKIVCVMCQNHTSGDFCEKCEDGYYKDRDSDECVPCQCNGHADRNYCNPETGLDCECKGHTRSPVNCEGADLNGEIAKICASQQQCSVCSKPGEYIGDPKDGRHCYRLMETFTNTFYIDPENKMYYNIDMTSPEAVQQMGLHPGQASFFYVQPTVKTGIYTHRVVLEILQGSVDLYVTDDYRMVRMDQTNISEAYIDLFDVNGVKIPPRPRTPPSTGNASDKGVSEKRYGSTISSSDVINHATRSRRSFSSIRSARSQKPILVSASGRNTSQIDYSANLKVRSVPPPRRESVVVLNALFTPNRNAMYVPLRNRKTVLIATNITGRFEVIIPNNDYYKKLSRRRQNYYFVIHNSYEVGAVDESGFAQTSTGIIYQVRKQVKMNMIMVIAFVILGVGSAFIIVMAFLKLYAYTVREPMEPQDSAQDSANNCRATVQVSLYFTSQLDSLPDKKSDVKSGGRNSHRKSAPQLVMGRQKYLQKVLALQPFKSNKEGPMTVLFETPAVSEGKKFFFGTAIISWKNSKEQPDIVAGNPTQNFSSQSSIFYNRSLSAREYSGSTNWFSTLQTHSPTRFGGGAVPGDFSRGGSVSTSESYHSPAAPNFSSLSRRGGPYHPIGYGPMMPLSGSMASPPHDSSSNNTLSRNSLQRSFPRSQTFFQRPSTAATPNVAATQLNLTSQTSLI